MTREDAIKTLKELWRETNDPWYEEVYDMAINTLETDRKTELQTEEQKELEAYRKCIKNRSFWDAEHCNDCYFYNDCPFNEHEDVYETPQTEMVTDYHRLDKPETDNDFALTYTCCFSDCENFKHFGFGEKCIECKQKQHKAMCKTKPQINEHITEDDAYYIVFKDLTKDEGLFTGKYDAKHGNKHYMYGINSVIEYIAYRVGKDCFNAFNEHFTNNMIKSEEAKEQNNE